MIDVPRWSLAEATAAVQGGGLAHEIGAAVGVPVIVLEVAAAETAEQWRPVLEALRRVAVVTVAEHGDVADASGDVDALVAGVLSHPVAATVAAQVLRRPPADHLHSLVLESLAYSTLQAGSDHRAWLGAQGSRVRNDSGERVRLEADDDTVTITMTRRRLHNLLDREGRDRLADAFALVGLAGDTRQVVWRGEGPSFCAGGDPAEFGSVADPAQAHAIRIAASPAPRLAAVADRVIVHAHGACVGAGIELAALAHRVIADPETRFRLPELSMGLIPGMGGTWSIPRRIGRRRTLAWLLLDLELDAGTALDWGLIDEIRAAN